VESLGGDLVLSPVATRDVVMRLNNTLCRGSDICANLVAGPSTAAAISSAVAAQVCGCS
jgi:hypothetical protein